MLSSVAYTCILHACFDFLSLNVKKVMVRVVGGGQLVVGFRDYGRKLFCWCGGAGIYRGASKKVHPFLILPLNVTKETPLLFRRAEILFPTDVLTFT